MEEPNLRMQTWRIGASRLREVLASLVVPKFYFLRSGHAREYPEPRWPGTRAADLDSATPTEVKGRAHLRSQTERDPTPRVGYLCRRASNPCSLARVSGVQIQKPANRTSRGSPALARREAVTRLLLSRSLPGELTSTPPSSCPRAYAHCLARDPLSPRWPRGESTAPEPLGSLERSPAFTHRS